MSEPKFKVGDEVLRVLLNETRTPLKGLNPVRTVLGVRPGRIAKDNWYILIQHPREDRTYWVHDLYYDLMEQRASMMLAL